MHARNWKIGVNHSHSWRIEKNSLAPRNSVIVLGFTLALAKSSRTSVRSQEMCLVKIYANKWNRLSLTRRLTLYQKRRCQLTPTLTLTSSKLHKRLKWCSNWRFSMSSAVQCVAHFTWIATHWDLDHLLLQEPFIRQPYWVAAESSSLKVKRHHDRIEIGTCT